MFRQAVQRFFLLTIFFTASLFIAGCQDVANNGEPAQRVVKSATFDDEFNAGDTWLIQWYLCGTDLESKSGAASADFQELLNVKLPENVKVLIQTGGTNQWQNNVVNAGAVERYLYDSSGLQRVESLPDADMGDVNTLADFIRYGAQMPADHRVFVFWNHGGGSAAGVCFDERNNSDSLYLRELEQALATTYKSMWDKFEFVGFDACLMSTLESANVLASYSNYMIASQESEPATGWEYGSIVQYLAKNPSCTGKELGKSLCDSYLDSVDLNTRGFTTLAVVDLSQIDQLMNDFYHFSQEMYASGEDQGTLAAMSRAINKAENFGCNNMREGYTNMVDLGGLVDACADVTPSAEDVQDTLRKAVTYQVRGTYHAGATGLSTYYPLKVNSSSELSIFQTVAVNPSYLSTVDRLAHGATYNGGTQYQQYSDDSFWQDNMWSWILGNTSSTQQSTQDYWSYVDNHSQSQSQASVEITYTSKPQVDDEGTYWFQLDQAGINNVESVSGMVYELSDDGADYIALGETYDVYVNWDNGEVADGFMGTWLSLPDGQSLNLTVEQYEDDYIIYTAPVSLNGKDCYLRMQQNRSTGKVKVEGAWNGLSANGSMDRNVTTIKKGDVIVPLYKATSADGSNVASDYEGNQYKVTAKALNISYKSLPAGTYLYRFNITDVFGDSSYTKAVTFEVESDGTIYFD